LVNTLAELASILSRFFWLLSARAGLVVRASAKYKLLTRIIMYLKYRYALVATVNHGRVIF